MSHKIKTIEQHIKYLSSTISDINKVLLEKDLPFLKVHTHTHIIWWWANEPVLNHFIMKTGSCIQFVSEASSGKIGDIRTVYCIKWGVKLCLNYVMFVKNKIKDWSVDSVNVGVSHAGGFRRCFGKVCLCNWQWLRTWCIGIQFFLLRNNICLQFWAEMVCLCWQLLQLLRTHVNTDLMRLLYARIV